MYLDRNSMRALQEHRIVELERAASRRRPIEDDSRPGEEGAVWWRREALARRRPRQA